MIKRRITKSIKKCLYVFKTTIILRFSQMIKTFLIKKNYFKFQQCNIIYLNGVETGIRYLFKKSTIIKIKSIFENKKDILIREVQRSQDIGIWIKIIIVRILSVMVFAKSSTFGMEIKYSDRKKIKFPGIFIDHYKPRKTYIVHKDNFHNVLMEPSVVYITGKSKSKK